jgi:hypothetical protein
MPLVFKNKRDCYKKLKNSICNFVSTYSMSQHKLMVKFTALIQKFNEQGEKTGWTYIEVPAEVACQLKPGNKKSFRVKGKFDDYQFEKESLLPMGNGDFIIPINATTRKHIHKGKGATLTVNMEVDERPLEISADLMECLNDEPPALSYFEKLPKSHQNYYSKWIESAKTEATKAKRIALTVSACARRMSYNEMMREEKSRTDILSKR